MTIVLTLAPRSRRKSMNDRESQLKPSFLRRPSLLPMSQEGHHEITQRYVRIDIRF